MDGKDDGGQDQHDDKDRPGNAPRPRGLAHFSGEISFQGWFYLLAPRQSQRTGTPPASVGRDSVESGGNANIGNALYGRGIDEVIARSNNNQGQFSFPDRNGNISVVLGFLGETLESYRYDAFGMPTFYNGYGTSIMESGISNALLYTGREWNQTFGLYEYRARGYDPKLGRFLSEDPKGFDAGDYNLYRYVGNDPLDRT
ncbi:MAG: RHS repeat-associated core domain-containing protein, partial [Verrucomicrobiota bacterium]|nr:RHS repeat-associated core domain-containing protein [Verrucomicrobiota bacterium]